VSDPFSHRFSGRSAAAARPFAAAAAAFPMPAALGGHFQPWNPKSYFHSLPEHRGRAPPTIGSDRGSLRSHNL